MDRIRFNILCRIWDIYDEIMGVYKMKEKKILLNAFGLAIIMLTSDLTKIMGLSITSGLLNLVAYGIEVN